MTHSAIISNEVADGRVQVEFCASRNWLHMGSNTCVYKLESNWNSHKRSLIGSSMTFLKPHACGIAQQYSSATFMSILFSFPQKKSPCLKNITESFFPPCLKYYFSRNFVKWNHVSRSVCVCVWGGGVYKFPITIILQTFGNTWANYVCGENCMKSFVGSMVFSSSDSLV